MRLEAAARDAVSKTLAEVHQEAEHAAGALRELQRLSFRQSAWQHVTIAVLAMAVKLLVDRTARPQPPALEIDARLAGIGQPPPDDLADYDQLRDHEAGL